jgi:formylglycine-generating enzyme required for sulfatase activity
MVTADARGVFSDMKTDAAEFALAIDAMPVTMVAHGRGIRERGMRGVWCVVCVGVGLAGGGALGAPPPDYGYTWATIGDPGNDPFPGENGINVNRGGVGYAYRMATTEVTVGHWLEFVEAYAPYAEDPGSRDLSGSFIFPRQATNDIGYTYEVIPGFENTPTNLSWRMAARYVNWLHNDKAITRDAFESGVYDTATFTQNADGTFNDQTTRSPGARYWIPSLDEWLKAVYYDPHKGGVGGWWTQPAGSDDALVPGAPGDGGETNAGQFNTFTWAAHRQVGSYAFITTPWGLLDASGGMAEWTEEWGNPAFRNRRIVQGSNMFSSGLPSLDDSILNTPGARPTTVAFYGLRIASAIPSPGGVPALVLAWTLARRRLR